MYVYIYIISGFSTFTQSKIPDGDLLVIFWGEFWDIRTSYRTDLHQYQCLGCGDWPGAVLEVDEEQLCNLIPLLLYEAARSSSIHATSRKLCLST